MTKTESTLICSELRKIDMDLDMLKAKLMTLSQDIQGSASLYGRKSKIKGSAKDAALTEKPKAAVASTT